MTYRHIVYKEVKENTYMFLDAKGKWRHYREQAAHFSEVDAKNKADSLGAIVGKIFWKEEE